MHRKRPVLERRLLAARLYFPSDCYGFGVSGNSGVKGVIASPDVSFDQLLRTALEKYLQTL